MPWFACDPVDAAFFTGASTIYRYPCELTVPPERVWESLTSEFALQDWGRGIQRLRWTSPRPFGVGTTREVTLPPHAVTVREHFFRWEEGSRYSFYVTQCNRPGIRALAEDYLIEPTAGGCRFTWTVALDPQRWSRLPLTPLKPLVKRFGFDQIARDARTYFAANP